MKNLFIYFILSCFLTTTLADMPGNEPREQVKVIVTFGDLQGYNLYAYGDHTAYGEDVPVKDSSEFMLNGGFGAPPCITFFGINKQEKYTDSITVCNEEQGNVLLKLSVLNGKLVPEEFHSRVEDVLPVVSDEPSAGNTPFFKQPINILVITALSAVLLLTGLYFIMQHKKHMV